MLYVAGEIFLWLALAFALGVLVGWFVWGIRRARPGAKAAPAVATAGAPTGDVVVRPAVRPVTEAEEVPPLPPTPPAGMPAIRATEPATVGAEGVTGTGETSSTKAAVAGAAVAAKGAAASAASNHLDDGHDEPTTEPVPIVEATAPEDPGTNGTNGDPAGSPALAGLVADEGPRWAAAPAADARQPTPAAGQPILDLDQPAAVPDDDVDTTGDLPGAAEAGEAGPGTAAGAGEAGRAVAEDDLQVVEGIGPRVEEVLKESGIGTWPELAQASPDRLRTILDLAGDQFRVHDPSSWPHQAELAAAGRWDELAALQAALNGGREG